MSDFKPTVILDFDGVLNSYTSGWRGVNEIPDPPVLGAREACQVYIAAGLRVVVVSSRSHQEGGIKAMKQWLIYWKFPVKVEVLDHKPPHQMTIDDRGYMFTGAFPPAEYIKNFIPWNKLPAKRRP